jgi:hypothetical protein
MTKPKEPGTKPDTKTEAETKPKIIEEESPEKIADYHRGSDNSIKSVMRSIKDDADKKGTKLSGVDEEDIDAIKEPDAEKPKIKEPPRKPSR